MKKVLVLLVCLMMFSLVAEAKWARVLETEGAIFSVDDMKMSYVDDNYYFWYSIYDKESKSTYVCRAQVDLKSLYARNLFMIAYEGHDNYSVNQPTEWAPIIPGSAYETVVNKAFAIYVSRKDNV